jgi:hypothetical protein
MDQVRADTLALGVFEEDRPPRGLAGLADWRLCGRISRLIALGQVTGRFREMVLFPGYGRFPISRVCVVGLGRRAEFNAARARETAWVLMESLRKLRAPSFITSLPGSPMASVPYRARMDLFLEELVRVYGPEEGAAGVEVFVVEPLEVHRDLGDVVSATMRKMRALWK